MPRGRPMASANAGISLGEAASAAASKAESAGTSASSDAAAAAAASAAEVAAEPGRPYDDLIKWPDEEPPPPEVWEVEAKYDWEKEERGYIFESRLEGAEEHKMRGNELFKAGEWEVALRRYKRAIYFCHFDQLQMHDLMEHHKEQVHQIQMTSKLNLVACIVRMSELESSDLPDGSLDHAAAAIAEVLESKPSEPKVHFRRGQVLMLQQELPGARAALDECRRLGGDGSALREAVRKLRELERSARERERQLYGGKIQGASVHQAEEAVVAQRAARRDTLVRALYVLGFPLVWPAQMMWRCVLALLRLMSRSGADPRMKED